MEQSLIRREIITETVKNRHIESLGIADFKSDDLEVYKSLFNNFVKEGFIKKGFFHDNIWRFKNKVGYTSFVFNLDSYNELQLALKCWALLKKSSSVGVSNLLGAFNKIKESIVLTNGFVVNGTTLSEFEQFLRSKPVRVSSLISSSILEFLSFINHINYEQYFELCDQYIYRYISVRELPPYQDILIFDDIINQFQLLNEDEKLKYYPILLWWKITKIIPMRPSDFCGLSRDCAKEQDGSYFLTVPRNKQKPKNNREIEITDTLQINEETYLLINEYLQLINIFPKTPYLLSSHAYRKFLKHNANNTNNIDLFNLGQFHYLLKHFFKEIVKQKFQRYDLERIKPGDTRHFAFCNMMLQGFNMLSIARIGGHNTLHSQMHYHNHLDYFAESFVYTLSQSYKMSRLNFAGPDLNLNSRELMAKASIFSLEDFGEVHKVDYGYCTDHPSRCKVGDCRFCNYFFIPKEDLPKAYEWLKDCSDVLSVRIKEQVELMKRISKDMFYDFETLQYQQTGQEHLFSTANELKRTIEQKAIVDSLLPEVDL